MLSACRPYWLRGLRLPEHFCPDSDRFVAVGRLHGGVRGPGALRAARGDVALPGGALRRLRERVCLLAPEGWRLRRRRSEPRGERCREKDRAISQ